MGRPHHHIHLLLALSHVSSVGTQNWIKTHMDFYFTLCCKTQKQSSHFEDVFSCLPMMTTYRIQKTHQTIAVFSHAALKLRKMLKMFYWTCLLLMDVPSLNSLFLSVVPALSALTVCSLKSSVLTVLSWLPPPPQHPLLLSPRCLSLPFYSFFAFAFPTSCLLLFFSTGLPPSQESKRGGRERETESPCAPCACCLAC